MKNVMMNDACSVSLQDKRAQFDLDDSGGKTQNSDLRDLARSVLPDPFERTRSGAQQRDHAEGEHEAGD